MITVVLDDTQVRVDVNYTVTLADGAVKDVVGIVRRPRNAGLSEGADLAEAIDQCRAVARSYE